MLRNALYPFTPPLLWSVGRRIKHWIRPPVSIPPEPPPITSIRFASWEAAKQAAGAYEDEYLTKFRATRYALNAASDNLPAIESEHLYWLRLLLGTDISITDFGGSFGEYGQRFLQVFPNSKYTVVETASVVGAAPESGVHFVVEMPKNCDVFYTSGTLQYLDDPYEVARRGLMSASKAAIFSRNCFCLYEMFRVQQSKLFENGTGAIPGDYEDRIVSYPIRMLSEAKITEMAISMGFKRLLRAPAAQTFADRDTYMVTLVFVRCNPPS